MRGFAKAAEEFAKKVAQSSQAETHLRLGFEAGAIWAQKYYLSQARNAEQPMTQYMRDELEGMAEGFAEEESQDAGKADE